LSTPSPATDPTTVDTAASASLSIYVAAIAPGAAATSQVSSELQINVCDNEVLSTTSSNPFYINIAEGASGTAAEIPSLHQSIIDLYQSLPTNAANPACNTIQASFYSDSDLTTLYPPTMTSQSTGSVILTQSSNSAATLDPSSPI
jgi:hypothetical protein